MQSGFTTSIAAADEGGSAAATAAVAVAKIPTVGAVMREFTGISDNQTAESFTAGPADRLALALALLDAHLSYFSYIGGFSPSQADSRLAV